MSKTACSDGKEIAKKSRNKELIYYCRKCGSKVAKEKWVCKPKKIQSI